MFGTVPTSTNGYQTNPPSGSNGTPRDDSKMSSWRPTGTSMDNGKQSQPCLKTTSGRMSGGWTISLVTGHIN